MGKGMNGCGTGARARSGAGNGGPAASGTPIFKQAFADTPVAPRGTAGWVYKLEVPAEIGQLAARFAQLYPELRKALPAYDAEGGFIYRENEKALPVFTVADPEDELAWEYEVSSFWRLSATHRCLLHQRKGKDGVDQVRYFWADGAQEIERDGAVIATCDPGSLPGGGEMGFELDAGPKKPARARA